jgi:hypothetical protein
VPEPSIRVEPSQGRRQAFARWAVQQWPKIATCSPTEFAVPAELFTEAPEELLLGSLVDGHAYVPVPAEELAEPPLALVGEAGPETVVPVADGPCPEQDPFTAAPADEGPDAPYLCEECGSTHTSVRGLREHQRRKHSGTD